MDLVNNMNNSSVKRTKLYKKVFLDIQHQFLEGQLLSGKSLPSVAKLCKEYKVSRITIIKALDELEKEGLIQRQQGRKCIVTGISAENKHKLNTDALFEIDISFLQESVMTVKFNDFIKPYASTLKKTKIKDKQRLFYFHALRETKKGPIASIHAYFSEDTGNKIKGFSFDKNILSNVLIKAGVHFASFEQILTATGAWPELAEELDIQPGVALVCSEKFCFDENRQVIAYIASYVRTDRYQYKFHSRSTYAKTCF